MVNLIGYIATALIVVSYIPQVITVYKTKSAKDFTYGFFLFMISAQVLWIGYAILTNSLPLLLVNGLSLIQILFILYHKIHYK